MCSCGPSKLDLFSSATLSWIRIRLRLAEAWKSNFEGPESLFRNFFIYQYFRYRLQKCIHIVTEQHFFKKLQTAHKICNGGIANMQLQKCACRHEKNVACVYL
jgi:hypothetical protein